MKPELIMRRTVQSNRESVISASPFPATGAPAVSHREEQGVVCQFGPPERGPSSLWRSSQMSVPSTLGLGQVRASSRLLDLHWLVGHPQPNLHNTSGQTGASDISTTAQMASPPQARTRTYSHSRQDRKQCLK